MADSLTTVDRPALLAFDVNETLLSLQPIRDALTQIFGDRAPVGEWFARMLHGSLVANQTDTFRPFGDIGVEALLTVAVKRGVALRGEEAEQVVGLMKSLPSHPEVYNAFERLFDSGMQMVALTNGSTEVANSQIENAGLHTFIQRVISVDEVGRFKPDPAPYRHAAEVMGVDRSEMTLVAAHDWDCLGAVRAGVGTVFVRRQGVVWSLPVPPPKRVVADIAELADLYADPGSPT